MTSTLQNTTTRRSRKALTLPALTGALMALTFTSAKTAQAQEAIGVPFVGKNHLSFYMTELSRDGIARERAALFGGVYGHRFNNREAPVQVSMIVRAAARALDGTNDGIVDAGLTLAATHAVRSLGAMSVTGAAGLAAVAWGQESTEQGTLDTGRVIARTPLSLGMAYDIRVGAATIAPFVALNGAYSSENDYSNGDRTAENGGWRLGHTSGVSVRFKEVVLSVSSINRERGLPNTNRVAFSAGVSW